MSNFFTFAFEFSFVSAFLFFGTAFVIGFLTRYEEATEAHAYQAPETLQPEFNGQSTPFACPVDFPSVDLDIEAILAEYDAANLGQQLVEAMADTDAALRECDVVLYKNMNSAELRKHCTAAGIQWRNAHGVNKHLKKPEMVEALTNA